MEVEPAEPEYTADVDAVKEELRDLPDMVVAAIGAAHIRVVACRNSVVDFDRSLSGVRPTNWPQGSTWDDVPGAYIPARRRIVVATIDVDGARRVPPYRFGHGSRSLAVHEALHGYDFSKKHRLSADEAFRDAWNEDHALLGDFYYQNAEHGPEESFAESGARHYGLDQSAANDWPHLRAFWGQHAGRVFVESMDVDAPEEVASDAGRSASIGWGEARDDGSLVLYLTAHGADGMVGHGSVTLPAGDAANAELSAKLGWSGTGTARGRFNVPPFDDDRVP